MAILFGLNEHQLRKLIATKMSAEDDRKYMCLFFTKFTLREHSDIVAHFDKNIVLSPDIDSTQTINISGVYIPVDAKPIESSSLVMVSV